MMTSEVILQSSRKLFETLQYFSCDLCTTRSTNLCGTSPTTWYTMCMEVKYLGDSSLRVESISTQTLENSRSFNPMTTSTIEHAPTICKASCMGLGPSSQFISIRWPLELIPTIFFPPVHSTAPCLNTPTRAMR